MNRPTDEQIEAFKKEILEVCKRHGMSISHEDKYGAFLIGHYGGALVKWFNAAYWDEPRSSK